MKFHHFIIPIAAAMVAIGLALIAAPRRFMLEILGADLILAISSVLIVAGAFCIASYGVVRVVEWADGHVTHKDGKQEPFSREE